MKSVIVLILIGGVCCSGCSTVKAWEKRDLARYEMSLQTDPLESKIKGHIYFSKEATSSGASVSGGGCGCN